MTEKSCTDLSFATMDELVEEIFSRSRGAVIVTEIEVPGEPGVLRPRFRWTGGLPMAMGLVKYCDLVVESLLRVLVDDSDGE